MFNEQEECHRTYAFLQEMQWNPEIDFLSPRRFEEADYQV